MSRSTMLGRSRETAASADAPSLASATTSKPWASSNALAESRKPGWSSTITTVGFISRSSHAIGLLASGLALTLSAPNELGVCATWRYAGYGPALTQDQGALAIARSVASLASAERSPP